jgi:pimeloyl-ACP methyl ester carboxylesterase
MYFKTENGKLWYTDSKKGSNVLVFLHGYIESGEIWSGIAQKLSKYYRIITLDLPGHGRSEFSGEEYTMEMMSDMVGSLINSLSINKVIMIGHSLGGYITLAFLDRHSEYLSGYCLFHSHPFPDNPETTEKRRKDIELISQGKEDSIFPDAVRKMYATVNIPKFRDAIQKSTEIASQTDGQGIIGILRGMIKRPSRVSLMEDGRVPCLLILGALDNFIDHNTILTKIKLPSNLAIRTLTKSGHMGFIEEEDLSVEILSEFAARLEDFYGA